MSLAAAASVLFLLTFAPQHAVTPVPSPGARALREMTDFLIGQWVGEGTGQPGQGAGAFAFERALDGNIVVRTSRSDYPAAEGRPAIHHEDRTILYAEGGHVRADYFDNEAHVIHYDVAFAHESATLTFVSPVTEGQPRYRLVYRPLGEDRVGVTFEIAPPGKPTEFVTYVKGTCKRVK